MWKTNNNKTTFYILNVTPLKMNLKYFRIGGGKDVLLLLQYAHYPFAGIII